MGARHSKRSVDITTTPKKGEEGAAVIEGEEGRLEKIAEPDLKVTTNGTLHNEIEFADKEETSKDETEDKEKVESISDIKENGLPEEPSNVVLESKKVDSESEKPTEQVNGETEKTPDKETPEQKVEDTPEQKKKKEKKKKWSFRPSNVVLESKNVDSESEKPTEQVNGETEKTPEQKVEETPEQMKKKEKKKKWSFRSISFSKKDKSKPSKESSEKNGEVKEVAEENVEDKDASPTTAETPQTEEAKPVEITESAAVTNGEATPTEEPAKPAEVETLKAVEETPKREEEPATPFEPELQQKIEEIEAPAKELVVEVPEPAVESTPSAATEEAPKVEEPSKEVRTEEVPPPLPSSNPPSPVTVFAESTKADAALTSGQVPLEVSKEVHEIIESSVKDTVTMAAPKVEESSIPEPPVVSEQASVTDVAAESITPISSEPDIQAVQKQSTESMSFHSDTAEPLPPSPPSPVPENVETVSKQSVESFSNASINTPENIPDPKVTIPEPSPSIEELPPAPPSPVPELPVEANTDKASLLSESVTIMEAASVLTLESATSQPNIPATLHDDPPLEAIAPTPVIEDTKKTEELSSETEPPAEPILVPAPPKSEETIEEPLTPPPTPAASTELPPPELSSAVDIPLAGSPTPPLDVSESVAPADSLPDISTESLPSLPEPVSESLPPMSLPPVDSVPDPIAPSEPESSPKEELPPVPLTNGNMNGHASPSPTEDAVLQSEVPGPTKQIASNVMKENEISPESGDTPSETAVVKTEE